MHGACELRTVVVVAVLKVEETDWLTIPLWNHEWSAVSLGGSAEWAERTPECGVRTEALT